MMLLQQARFRAQAAQDRAKTVQDQAKDTKKVALETEKDNDAAQNELHELQRVMEPKRARTNATTANDHEECDEQSSDDMDIADYRGEAAHIQKRRSVALGSREDVPTQESPCCRLRNKSHRAAVSRYRAAEEAGSTVGCQGLALFKARCVGLCAGSVAMVH